jgi:peptidoglycan/xylan/chitin deacetylase (PgdA/CDA1 family)
MKNNNQHTFILSFDIEEFTIPEEKGAIKTKKEREYIFKIGAEGVKRIIEILKKEDVPSTCFCTYEFFHRYPELVEEIHNMGSEVAIHAYAHKDNYQTMDKEETLKKLIKAKKEIEETLGTHITGFRGPGFRAPSFSTLQDAGFVYDSSLHPTYVPRHYNNLGKSRKIRKVGGNKGKKMWVVPISVLPFLRFPFSWIWFRNLPLLYTKICTLASIAADKYTLLYFHPWECVDLKKELDVKLMEIGRCSKPDLITKLATRKTGPLFEAKLISYIKWAKKKGSFKTIDQYLKVVHDSLL